MNRDPLISGLAEVWEMLAGTPISFIDTDNHAEIDFGNGQDHCHRHGYSVTIHGRDAPDTLIVVRLSDELRMALASAMFMEDTNALTLAQLDDAGKELTNICAGCATHVREFSGDLGIPETLTPHALSTLFDTCRIARGFISADKGVWVGIGHLVKMEDA